MTATSVVIRTFNEEQHIGRLLTGIDRQTVQPREIILVDSGSTDATLEIASHFDVTIRSIAPDQFSFGRSLNLGCEIASSDLLVIVSAHVYPVTDSWMAQLIAPFSNPNVALVYGRQVGDPLRNFSESQVLRRWYPGTSDAHQSHPFCNNANAAIRREVWTTTPYDETLTGLEDLDWGKRVQQKGYHIAYVAEAAVVHIHEESLPQTFNRYRREAIAYKRIFGNRPVGYLETIALALRNIGNDYWQAVRQRVLMKNLWSIPSFRLAQFWGAHRGFSQRGPVPIDLKRRFYYPPQARAEYHAMDVPPTGVIDYSSLAKDRRRAEDP